MALVVGTSYPANINFDDDGHSQTQPLRHFIDDWPKSHPERTQLSISIPADFSSSSNSLNREKLALSPLRISWEFYAINERNERHTHNWVPISWEPSLGGPLGEVLNNTKSTPKGLSKNCSSSSLNLLTDGWDSSLRLEAEASPTGVLQKTTFGSLSSSSGSSPRPNNQCDDLGSNLVDPPSTPITSVMISVPTL
ncbi:uncharacterized protein A4U43_C01F10170 [Asparagus officinalis]|uniref:Uncharacterized protein n=1 Tax=Asparagus officinalis TaxID=4686 RepID=A0A5P1FQU6_ASPOF|nr:uncharacterized protein A4U43_C01F10170 [Asparagus officinalis]